MTQPLLPLRLQNHNPTTLLILKVSALIDTGSSVNIISEELCKSLPNSKKRDITVNIKDAIVLANNQKIDVIGTNLKYM
jgi:hypothetical protein